MPEQLSAKAAIAFGSNLGVRQTNLKRAIEAVSLLGKLLAVSSFTDTAPVGYLDQPRFLNGALVLETRLSPVALLEALLAIEHKMGRDRTDVPAKGPRVIDLDLIFYQDVTLFTPELTLPHPEMHQRRFVLEPLAELAPEWVHPILSLTVAELLRRL